MNAVIGVAPAIERAKRARLFDTLERAYPVRFEPRESGAVRGLDALLGIGPDGVRAVEKAPRIRSLVCLEDERAAGERRLVALADDSALARPLRGSRLSETRAAPLDPVEGGTSNVALATVAGIPAWGRRPHPEHPSDRVWLAPEELRPGEVLRSRLAPGRCLAMLALVQFVRDALGGRLWELPQPRAAFVIDDPNLRWPSYGHLNYGELARSALKHRYHTSIAMVPLDGWPAHPRVVKLFQSHRDQLSLCVHGNDHNGGELGRPRSSSEALPPVAQSLRRVRAFERRTGLGVDRVMVPPRECVSEAAAAALTACGYEALAATRTYPWIEIGAATDVAWLTRPAEADALTGWGSAALMPDGLPLLVRMVFEHPREEFVIRAFLGQPVVVYGHHDLLEHGPAELETVAQEINRTGDVRWHSLAGIARASVESRRTADVLELRMLGRRVTVEVPPVVKDVYVDTTALPLPDGAQLLVTGCGLGGAADVVDGMVQLAVHQPGPLELALRPTVDPSGVPAPQPRLTPIARRLVAEFRSRALPVANLYRGRGEVP